MNGQIESHGHVAVSRRIVEGVVTRGAGHATLSVVHADTVVVGEPDGGMPAATGESAMPDDCFRPETCCDELELQLIAALRAYLRPDVAPECLMRRLRETLDHCCCDESGE